MEIYFYNDLNSFEKHHWWHISKRRTVLELLRRFSPKKNPKLLDIGCGTGENLTTFNKIFKSVEGIDMSPVAIKFCHKKGLKNIREASSYKTKTKTNTIDIVTLLDVLEHTDENKTLTETNRILSSGGIVIITVPAISWLWSELDVILHHVKRYNRETLENALKRNGFEIVKCSYLYTFLVLPVLLIRTIKSLFFKDMSYPADEKISSPPINWFMLKIADFERQIFNIMDLPFGTSLVCVAKKP